MKDKFYPPIFSGKDFHCPICGVYAHQDWYVAYIVSGFGITQSLDQTVICTCSHCVKYSIWYEGKMIQPNIGGAPIPNSDLPLDIKNDYNEARDIINKSPRGASALLRLAIQKLCEHLGEKGDNINNDIANLVKKGLSVKIQQALDFVRVVGNNAVHPGQIDLKDNSDIALNLFSLVNVIAEVMITQPKEIDTLYNSLPDKHIEAINKRDKKENG
jgi:hypothetical protein